MWCCLERIFLKILFSNVLQETALTLPSCHLILLLPCLARTCGHMCRKSHICFLLEASFTSRSSVTSDCPPTNIAPCPPCLEKYVVVVLFCPHYLENYVMVVTRLNYQSRMCLWYIFATLLYLWFNFFSSCMKSLIFSRIPIFIFSYHFGESWVRVGKSWVQVCEFTKSEIKITWLLKLTFS